MSRSTRIIIKYFLKRWGPAKIGISILVLLLITTVIYPEIFRKAKHTVTQNEFVFEFFAETWTETIPPEKIDWHGFDVVKEDSRREGLGEHGAAAELDEDEKSFEDEVFALNGYNGALSDRISVNRSVPDTRNRECVSIRYYSVLPSVSVVLPCYEEHLSVLLRTCHSIVNRSPAHLLLEIIIVDDGSTKADMGEPLERYIAEHLPKVKVIRHSERLGLIRARVDGAKIAKGEVLVFLDSHTEANVNWLPPLLQPIAENYRTCVCPFIDAIDDHTLAYRVQDGGYRGGFDWLFYYLEMKRFDYEDPTEIYESPVMVGGLFAISSKFFWELGGYDEGLDIWGGEQFEISFKIWQCGGKMYDAPCSRVGHLYRSPPFPNSRKGIDFLTINFKRVAEVWMDEYKEYLYMRNPKRWSSVDVGDLTKQKAVRERNQCKSFKWYLENVAPDMLKQFPPIEPPDYASGVLKNLGISNYCIDIVNLPMGRELYGYDCAADVQNPQHNQHWRHSWRKDIRNKDNVCWTINDKHAPIRTERCLNEDKLNMWRYDKDTKWLVHMSFDRCLDIDDTNKYIVLNVCDANNQNMKWEWGFVNETRMAEFDDDPDYKLLV